MKVSKLIKKLKDIQDKHGDIPVYRYTHEELDNIEHIIYRKDCMEYISYKESEFIEIQ